MTNAELFAAAKKVSGELQAVNRNLFVTLLRSADGVFVRAAINSTEDGRHSVSSMRKLPATLEDELAVRQFMSELAACVLGAMDELIS